MTTSGCNGSAGISLHNSQCSDIHIQSGASSRSKIGGAYFSDVTESLQDPTAVPGPCEVTEF